ncbi:MAG: hypothetical protein NMNS01_11000 [Nitrosomonas sp.]|nr:MAG: hypothetical protein NMNS01_11000 [Nitrosomonas sp.]
MSMKKWTDEELISTRNKLETWNLHHKAKGWGPRLWILTALMGAFAISTGVVFIFLDGIDVLSIILIVLGSVTCFSWYQSEKKKKETITFLAEVNSEIDRRERREEKPKAELKSNKKGAGIEGARKKESGEKNSGKEQAEKNVSDQKTVE